MWGWLLCIYHLHVEDNLKVTWLKIVEIYLSGGKIHWRNVCSLSLSRVYVSRQRHFYEGGNNGESGRTRCFH